MSQNTKLVDKFRASISTDTIVEAIHVQVFFSLDL